MAIEPKTPGVVLYVEDDEVTRRTFGAMLARRIEGVHLAENGHVGLEQHARHAPDVVITDITMPGLDGLAMARQLKERCPELPILVTSAYSDTQYLLDAIAVGVDGYVLKPIEFDRLLSLVRRHLTAVDHRRQVARHHEEQARLLAELQAAAHTIKTLSGLLPLCMHCKSIRDDKGYWTRVEAYLAEHADLQFSHGICPSCVRAHYAELEEEGPAR